MKGDVPLKDMKTLSIGSCLGPPEETALGCMKRCDQTGFNDLVLQHMDEENQDGYPLPDDHWINKNLPEEADKTLLMVAIKDGLYEFADTLLRAGANAALYSYDLKKCPLHMACEKSDLTAVKLLFKYPGNVANVNSKHGSSGRTALHICAEKKFREGLEFLLALPQVQVDVRDKKGQQTPLFVAINSGDVLCARLLISHRADVDYECFGMLLREHIKEKMPGLDPDKVQRVVPPLANQTSLTVLERLADILAEDGDECKIEFQDLLVGVDGEQLAKFTRGSYNLVQRACFYKKADLLDILLSHKSSLTANSRAESSAKAPVLLAATNCDLETLKVLHKHEADFLTHDKDVNETVLHFLLKQVDNRQEVIACMDYLFTEHSDVVRKIVNRRNVNADTAMHYAATRWPQSVVRGLLEAGANVGMKNQWGQVSVVQILPDTLEQFLDQFCLKGTEDKDVNHRDFEITFNYTFLAPSNDDLPNHVVKENVVDPEDAKANLTPDKPAKCALPETEALWHMGQSKAHRHLLKHPVITSFLWLKWVRIRRYYNRNLRFYMLFVFVLTWHIFQKFGGVSLERMSPESGFGEDDIAYIYFLYIIFTIFMAFFIVKDWHTDLQDIQRAEEGRHSFGQCCRMILSNWVEILLMTFIVVLLVVGAKALWTALLVLTGGLVLRELFQVSVSLRRYLLSPENWIEVSTIVLICIILFHPDDNVELKRPISGMAIILSWAELITLVGKHPKLTRYNVYVTMFYKVMCTFFFFLLWYAFFIVAFGLAFYIMLHNDNGKSLEEAADEKDSYVYFDRPWLALVKTSTMFVGELEFSDIPINLGSSYRGLAYIFFLAFVFLIVVVLMNLLNGLAVSDTGSIQEKAETYTYISRVDTISYTESLLLGDPFDFLSSWPAFKWLKYVPTCSFTNSLNKSKKLKSVFNKITGATGILLFYNFLPYKTLTIRPNRRDTECFSRCMNVEVMAESIVNSAKNLLMKQRNEKDCHSEDSARIMDVERKVDRLTNSIDDMKNLMEALMSKQ